MFVDCGQPSVSPGVITFPDVVFTEQPKGYSEIKNLVIVAATPASTLSVPGGTDDEE